MSFTIRLACEKSLTMSKRNLIIFLLLAVAVVAAVLLLKPCAAAGDKTAVGPAPAPAAMPAPAAPAPAGAKNQPVAIGKPQPVEAKDRSAPVEKNVPPAPAEIDTAPPVVLTNSEQIPDVGKCAIANFPSEAKPHVKVAIVTVRLIVDKFGNVRSDTPLEVEFPQEVAEDVLPAMRKLFIKAGSRAFGAKKCPPHVVNGQNVGYAIEVPLQYKH